jgi:hypothetical protein
MDEKQLHAKRAAAAARGDRGIERASAARVEATVRAGGSRRADRPNRSTRSVDAVLRKGGRSGTHRKLDAVTE